MSKSNRFIMVICLLLDLFISTATAAAAPYRPLVYIRNCNGGVGAAWVTIYPDEFNTPYEDKRITLDSQPPALSLYDFGGPSIWNPAGHFDEPLGRTPFYWFELYSLKGSDYDLRGEIDYHPATPDVLYFFVYLAVPDTDPRFDHPCAAFQTPREGVLNILSYYGLKCQIKDVCQ